MSESNRIDVVPASVFNVVAQMSHWLGGCLAVVWPQFLFGGHAGLYAGAIIIVLAAVKEFWFDYKFETPQERGSSLLDFVMYCVGVALGIGSIILKGL